MIAMTTEILGAQITEDELLNKAELLESRGYRYHFARMCYFNRAVKRVFSIEFFEERSLQEIQTLLETPSTNDWTFHFTKPSSDWCKQELARALEK